MPTPITVSVNFIDLVGTAISGYMVATVVPPTGVLDLYVSGVGIISPKAITSATGTSVSVQVWGNDVIVDAADGTTDTYYTINLFNTSNVLVWSATYLFTGSGSVNLVGYPRLTLIPAAVTPTFPVVQPPGGGNTDVQYNNGNVFGGDSQFQYNSAGKLVSIGGGLSIGGTVLTSAIPLTVTQLGTGPTNVSSTALFLTDGVTPGVGAYFQSSGYTFTLRMDSTLQSSHGILQWDSRGFQMDGGANSGSFHLYTGAPAIGYTGIPNQSAQIDLAGSGLFAVTANPGAGNKGEILLDPFNTAITFYGSISGNAAIGTGTAAGTPNKLLLPLTTGAANTLLTTNGANPQQTSWVTPTSLNLASTIASGTATLGTVAIASGAKAATVTVAATGVLTTDTVMADFNADPTGVTGYVPSAAGMLTLVKFCTANSVNFIVINNTGASVTPGAITLNWRVVR